MSYENMLLFLNAEAVIRRCQFHSKKGVLRNFSKFTGEHLCQSLFFNKVAGLRHFEISKNTFYSRTPLVAASVNSLVNAYKYSIHCTLHILNFPKLVASPNYYLVAIPTVLVIMYWNFT